MIAVLGALGIRTLFAASGPKPYFQGKDAPLEAAVLADNRAAIAQALAAGANVNARGIADITPLMLAVDRQKPNAVAELLARGADPNLKAKDGNGAVNLAVENYRNAPEILFAILRAGGDPNTRRPDDDPILMRFVNDHNCEFMRHLKAFGADMNVTTREDEPIISSAATGRDWDDVWCLIELGAKIDYEHEDRWALSRNFFDDYPAPDSPIFPYKKKVWQFLKEHGIAVPPLKE